MKTYRMSCAARLYFDIKAETEEEAKKLAKEMLDRCPEGCAVPNADPEGGLEEWTMYPSDVDYDLEVCNIEEAA